MDTLRIKSIVFYVIVSIIVIAYFFIRLPELKTAFFIGTTLPYDFPQDYIAGRQLLAGKTLYPPDFVTMYRNLLASSGGAVNPQINHLNAHPPFTALLLYPLWLFSFHNAAVIWGAITILCSFAISLLLMKAEDASLMYVPLLSLFILAWPPFQANVAVGQVSVLVALFVSAGWYLYKKHKDLLAGIFITLATMLKFYPGLLLLYFLFEKKYKLFWSSIAGIVIIMVITLILTKYDVFHFLFTILPADSKYSGADIGNLSINGYFAKLFLSVKAYYITGTFAASENYVLKNIFLAIAVALLLFYSALSIRKYRYDNDLGFSVFIVVSLLVSPLCWNHYLTLLLLPLIVFAKELLQKRTISEVVLFLTGLFFISIDTSSVYFLKVLSIVRGIIPGNPESFFYRMTFYSLPFYGMVLLLYLNFRLIKNYSTSALHDTEGGGAALD